jgi:polyphosphate kinase 2 (PPK2 family)
MPDERTVLFKDRFQPGDFVYVGEHTAERAQQMGREFEAYEQHVVDEGALPFKAILWADTKKQSKTFGKRMARGAFADALISELRDRNTLTPDIEQSLLDVKNKVEAADMKAVVSFDETLARYEQFAAEADGVTPFPVIDATDRHAARLDLMQRFLTALEEHRGRALEG